MGNGEGFISIGEPENAMNAIDEAAAFLSKVPADPYGWKWFVIALHNGIYCFMLHGLLATDGLGIWQQEKRDGEGTPISHSDRIVDFLEAFNRLQQPQYTQSNQFNAKDTHKDGMRRLNNELRNDFAHFHPDGKAIPIACIVDACLPTLDVIKHVASLTHKRIFNEDTERQSVLEGADSIVNRLQELRSSDSSPS